MNKKVNSFIKEYLGMFHELKPEIDKNIEQHRKGSINLNLRDRNGKAINNTLVNITQKQHDFTFGCNALMLGQLGENNDVYEQEFVRLFNLVTTTLCWNTTEVKQGEFRFEEGAEEIFRRPPADRVRNFAKKYNLRFKGQPLLADSWYPEWASKDPAELKEQYKVYFQVIADRYGKDLYMVDVVNEAYLCKNRTPHFPLYDENLSYVPWAMKMAGEIFPDSCILERNEASLVNYGTEGKRYIDEIKKLKEDKIRIDAVGLQFHMFNSDECLRHLNGDYLNLKDIYANYMKMSALNVPMYISEVTVPSNLSGFTKEEGEYIQAIIVECLYELWFSIPSMKGIIYWNLKDGKAWRNEGDCMGCLLDENLKEKPSYAALYQFINRKHSTTIKLQSNKDGQCEFRGYYGIYDVDVEIDGKVQKGEFTLDRENKNIEIILR